MRTRLPPTKVWAAIAAVLAGAAGGALLWSAPFADASGDSTPAAPPELTSSLVSCAALAADLSRDVEHNTLIDPEHGLLSITTYDPVIQGDRTITIDYQNDPACRALPTLRLVIDDAVRTWQEDNRQECWSLTSFYEGGGTNLRGQSIDRGALLKYLQRWCNHE